MQIYWLKKKKFYSHEIGLGHEHTRYIFCGTNMADVKKKKSQFIREGKFLLTDLSFNFKILL